MTNFIDDAKNFLFSDKKEAADKISDQHILMLKLKDITARSKRSHISPIFPNRTIPGEAIGRIPGEDIKKRFINLCVLDHDKPYAIPNLIMTNEKENGTMLKLTTLQLSLLVPRIRIFKIIYNRDSNKEIKIELPFDDVAAKDDLERIFTNTAGRGSGCGIKSFEWKSMAQNQANLFQFSATLALFIQNIEEMSQVRNSTEDNGQTHTVSILDLLYPKPSLRNGPNEGSNTYDPKYFGIKVEVGWHIDPGNEKLFKDQSILYQESGEKVLEVIKEQKNIFFLTLKGHNFEFNEDGSIELTIDYIASSEIEASDSIKSNILRFSNEIEAMIKAAQIKLKNANNALNKMQSASGKSETELSSESGRNPNLFEDKFDRFGKGSHQIAPTNFQDLKIQKENAQKELENIGKTQRIEKMKSIIQSLLERDLLNKAYIPYADYEAYSNLRSLEVVDVESVNEVSRQIMTARNNIKIAPINSANWGSDKLLAGIVESGITAEVFVAGNPVLNAFTTQQNEQIAKDKDITFFLLGDLLDVVLTHVFNRDDEHSAAGSFMTKSNRVLLGPITYYDYGSIEDSNTVVRTKGVKGADDELFNVYSGQQQIANIADIPISVNEFMKWYVKEIIEPAKEVMSFLDFARTIINSLVIPAISSEGFKFAPSQQVRVNLLPFSAPRSKFNEEIFRETVRNPLRTFRYQLKGEPGAAIISMPGVDPGNPPFESFMNTDLDGDKQNYILLYGVEQPPFERVAEEQSDLTDKIFHIYIGEERGLIKKVNFSRDDNPRSRANNIQLSNPSAMQEGMIIREKYSGTFNFFGNFLFQPGGQVFVHPTYVGLKGRNVRENLFSALGLGGYYMIIEVNSKIEASEFTTTVVTRWSAFGDGTSNIGDQLNGEIVKTDPSNRPSGAKIINRD